MYFTYRQLKNMLNNMEENLLDSHVFITLKDNFSDISITKAIVDGKIELEEEYYFLTFEVDSME